MILSEPVCNKTIECYNETSYRPGTCKDMCDYGTEYEIMNSYSCNGENCSCCAVMGKVFFN